MRHKLIIGCLLGMVVLMAVYNLSPKPDSEREEIISFTRQALEIEAKRNEFMRYLAGLRGIIGLHGQRAVIEMRFSSGVPPEWACEVRGVPPSGFEGMASLLNKLLMLDCPQSMQPVKDTLIYIYRSEIGQAQLQQLQLEIRELQEWGGARNLVYPRITKDNLEHWRQLKEQHGPVGAKHSFYKHMVETVWFGLQESRRGIYVRWAEILHDHGIDPAEEGFTELLGNTESPPPVVRKIKPIVPFPPAQWTPRKSIPEQQFDAFSKEVSSGPLESLRRYWFHNEPLTNEERTQLETLFQKYPMGAPNFNTWLEQTLRKQWENVNAR